jgi:hypothetical protein
VFLRPIPQTEYPRFLIADDEDLSCEVAKLLEAAAGAIRGCAFGFRLKRNVIDTYKFACRNYKYESDDSTFPNMSIAMFNRIILVAVVFAISTAASAAKDKPKQEECPTLDHQEIEDLLRKAPSCQRAGALFESCQFGASGDVRLGAIVTEKCEGDFLGKLTAAQRRAYDLNRSGASAIRPREWHHVPPFEAFWR